MRRVLVENRAVGAPKDAERRFVGVDDLRRPVSLEVEDAGAGHTAGAVVVFDHPPDPFARTPFRERIARALEIEDDIGGRACCADLR